MNDLISRQAAIDAIERIFDRCEEIEAHLPEGERTGYKMYPDYITVWKYLHQLPSTQPERQGRWFVEEKDSVYGKKYILTCSECGDIYAVSEDALPYEKYCRNCGARNRRE